MPRPPTIGTPAAPAARVEVETISLRLPKPLALAIRKHCETHAKTVEGVLGAQPPTISSVIRALIDERFGDEALKLEQQATKSATGSNR